MLYGVKKKHLENQSALRFIKIPLAFSEILHQSLSRNAVSVSISISNQRRIYSIVSAMLSRADVKNVQFTLGKECYAAHFELSNSVPKEFFEIYTVVYNLNALCFEKLGLLVDAAERKCLG